MTSVGQQLPVVVFSVVAKPELQLCAPYWVGVRSVSLQVLNINYTFLIGLDIKQFDKGVIIF